MKKKIVYVDMDGVLVDFKSAIDQLSEEIKLEYKNRLDEVPGIFSLMAPMPNAIEAITELHNYYDIYTLSTAPWNNPTAWVDKLQWIQKHLPKIGYKRLILSHNKQLNKGDYLIDDRKANGVSKFEGEQVYFGKGKHKDWMAVYSFLLRKVEFKKLEPNVEVVLIEQIKIHKNRKAINALYKSHRHLIELIVLQYCNDLSNKEHKILQSKAREGFIKGVIKYECESGHSLIGQTSWFIRQEVISYKMKKAGKVRSPFIRGFWTTKEEIKEVRKRLQNQNKDES